MKSLEGTLGSQNEENCIKMAEKAAGIGKPFENLSTPNEGLINMEDENRMDAGISKLPSESEDSCVKETGADLVREDVIYKASIRMMRKFYRDLFKKENRRIVRKRYVNCRPSQIFQKLKSTLSDKIPEAQLTKEVVYFTMGITNLKKITQLS